MCISPCIAPQESRSKLFVDHVKLGGDVSKLVSHFSAELSESQSSTIKWGFRPLKWLEDRHGVSKAAKLVERKKSLGLFLDSMFSFPILSNFHPFPLWAFPKFTASQNMPTWIDPRLIQDPELPDDPDERLFFTMINLDMSNVSELKRITRLEMEGLKAFTKAIPSFISLKGFVVF